MAFPVRGTPYTEAFYAVLKSQGAEVREGIFAGRWLLKHVRDVDYIHLHWPSFFYNGPNILGCLRGFGLFLLLLLLARLRGARVIWTVHNVYPHDPCVIPMLHKVVRRILVGVSTRFLIHGPAAEAEVLRHFPAVAGRTILIDHGNWIGYYPNNITRGTARKKLELDDKSFIFLFIGVCKPYKNLEALIDAFGQIGPGSVLLIAGRFDDPEYESRVRSAAARSGAQGAIKFHSRYIPDEELQVFLKAADVVVAPYAETLTSGTAMLALSFGRPIVAPARGSLNDFVDDSCGVLYPPSQLENLPKAMLTAMNTAYDESRIITIARKHDWSASAAWLLKQLEPIAARTRAK